MPLAGHGLRPTPLRQRASRPQLKRDPLGSARRREQIMLNSAAQYLLLGTALCLAPLNALRAQFCWECYQPRTLRQLVDSAPEPPDSGFVFRGNDHPSRVLVTYTGKKRAVGAWRSAFIRDYYEKALRQPLPTEFKDELLFLEDSVEYWLPVQSQVLPYFARKVTPGDRVWLFIVWPGGTARSKRPDWIFLVNEFQKP